MDPPQALLLFPRSSGLGLLKRIHAPLEELLRGLHDVRWPAQIEKYGVEGAKSIRKMLAARVVFPPKEFEDAEAVSKELGTYTVRQKSVSRPMWGGAGKSSTVNISDQPRCMLLPKEVKELGAQRMILFYEGLRPVLANRIYYFRDGYLARRELPPPEVPKLEIAGAEERDPPGASTRTPPAGKSNGATAPVVKVPAARATLTTPSAPPVRPFIPGGPVVPRQRSAKPVDPGLEIVGGCRKGSHTNAARSQGKRCHSACRQSPGGARNQGPTAASPAKPNPVSSRPVDLEHTDNLDLHDFTLDFDDVVIPKTKWTDAEIDAAADSFVSRMLD